MILNSFFTTASESPKRIQLHLKSSSSKQDMTSYRSVSSRGLWFSREEGPDTHWTQRWLRSSSPQWRSTIPIMPFFCNSEPRGVSDAYCSPGALLRGQCSVSLHQVISSHLRGTQWDLFMNKSIKTHRG